MKLTKSLLLKLIREEMEAEMGSEEQHADSGEPFWQLLNVLIDYADGSPTHVSRFDVEGVKNEVEKLYTISGDRVHLTDFGKKVVAALFPEDSAKFLEPSEREKNIIKKVRGEPYQPDMFESKRRR